MTVDDADGLVAFQDVRVISSTALSLLCGIGDKRVWLPRRHISGKLWCTGDRGKLFIRRWVAHDRRLINPHGADAVAPLEPTISRRRPPDQLPLVRGDEGTDCAE